MRRIVLSVIAVSFLLSGCASPASQQNLANLQAQCAAGDADACTAANYQAQANQVEAAQNASALTTGLAILGVAAGVGAAIDNNNSGHYNHYNHHR